MSHPLLQCSKSDNITSIGTQDQSNSTKRICIMRLGPLVPPSLVAASEAGLAGSAVPVMGSKSDDFTSIGLVLEGTPDQSNHTKYN